jgi:hypothetical protein
MGRHASLSKEVSAMLAIDMTTVILSGAKTLETPWERQILRSAQDDEVAIIGFAHKKSAVAQRRASFIDRHGEVN